MASSDKTEDLIKEAQALIDKVQAQLEESDEILRRQGLDPAKVHAVAQAQMTPAQKAEAQAAFKADMEAVEQEVQQEMTRRSFSQPASTTTSGIKRHRNLI